MNFNFLIIIIIIIIIITCFTRVNPSAKAVIINGCPGLLKITHNKYKKNYNNNNIYLITLRIGCKIHGEIPLILSAEGFVSIFKKVMHMYMYHSPLIDSAGSLYSL